MRCNYNPDSVWFDDNGHKIISPCVTRTALTGLTKSCPLWLHNYVVKKIPHRQRGVFWHRGGKIKGSPWNPFAPSQYYCKGAFKEALERVPIMPRDVFCYPFDTRDWYFFPVCLHVTELYIKSSPLCTRLMEPPFPFPFLLPHHPYPSLVINPFK